MNCRRTEQLLSNYMEGLLSAAVVGAVEAHLGDCPTCRNHRDNIRALEAELRGMPALLPLPDIERRAVRRWMAEQEETGRPLRDRLPWRGIHGRLQKPAASLAPLAAAAALLALIGLALGPHHRHRSSGHGDRTVVRRPPPERPTLPLQNRPPLLPGYPGRQFATRNLAAPRLPGEGRPLAPFLANHDVQREIASNQPHHSHAGARLAPPAIDDLAYLNRDSEAAIRRWAPLPPDRKEAIEAQVRRDVRLRDDFVTIPFPEIASASKRQIVKAVESYKREAAVVDSRLFHKVSLALKGASLDEQCAALQAQTGVPFRAARGVGDDKVTVVVEKRPARDVMRAIVQLFGYTWSRTRKEAGYHYELVQDLRSQLAEEAGRQQDMSAALLGLDRAMQAYQPYMGLSPDEMKARLEHARGEEWKRLAHLVDGAWVGVKLYNRLTPAERAALLTGQPLVFTVDAVQPDRRIPPEWVQPLSWTDSGQTLSTVTLQLDRTDLGRLVLHGTINQRRPQELMGGGRGFRQAIVGGGSFFPLAECVSPSMQKPDNAAANQGLRSQRPFKRVVSIKPRPSCTERSGWLDPDHKLPPPVFTSDVWEAVHRATGQPVVADFYSHRYPVASVTVARAPLFDALCRAGDAMGVRWRREGDFLLGRSTSFLWDRLKEVPNRYRERWQREKREHGGLPLDALLEMASLSDDQLSATDMGFTIVDCWDLPEWGIVASLPRFPLRPVSPTAIVTIVRPGLGVRIYSNQDPRPLVESWVRNPPSLRPEVRFFGTLTPAQRQQALQPDGIAFGALTPEQQRGFLQLWEQVEDLREQRTGRRSGLDPQQFVNARFSAEYIPAGTYLWQRPNPAHQFQPLPERTAAEALAAVNRIEPDTNPRLIRLCRDGAFMPRLWIGTVPPGASAPPRP